MLRVFASMGFLALLTACATSQSMPAVSSGTSWSRQSTSLKPATCCDISWNKKRVILHQGVMARGVLTFWAKNGYFFYPIYCANGSQISVATGRTWGDPNAYEHVIVRFETQSPGPDKCSITAVLNDTGSPPLAYLILRVK